MKHRPDDKCGTAIAYHAAAVGIVLHKMEAAGEGESEGQYRQSFHTGHNDDIVSFAVHPSLDYVATGQLEERRRYISGARPQTYRREAQTRPYLSPVVPSRASISALCPWCASLTAAAVASIGQDDSHSIAVYNWNSGALVSTAKGDGNKVLAMSFVPGSNDIVTCGIRHVRFWTVKGRNLSSKKGVLGSKKVNNGVTKRKARKVSSFFEVFLQCRHGIDTCLFSHITQANCNRLRALAGRGAP